MLPGFRTWNSDSEHSLAAVVRLSCDQKTGQAVHTARSRPGAAVLAQLCVVDRSDKGS